MCASARASIYVHLPVHVHNQQRSIQSRESGNAAAAVGALSHFLSLALRALPCPPPPRRGGGGELTEPHSPSEFRLIAPRIDTRFVKLQDRAFVPSGKFAYFMVGWVAGGGEGTDADTATGIPREN